MMDHLEKQIAHVLDGVSAEDRKRGGLQNGEWTGLIKERLCALGQSLGYGVDAAKCKGADHDECMFDLIWAADKEEFREMPLAMECVLSTNCDDIFKDFEKLLIAKAQHKLFVFQQCNDKEVTRVTKDLSAEARKFRPKLPEERYMLAGWSSERRSFIYHVVTG